jgi:hypothetical protein
VLGFQSARRIVRIGRATFFGTEAADSPGGRSPLLQEHDLIPQFGFVGDAYCEKRVLILGINPGNGPKDDMPTPADARMMPMLQAFAREPSEQTFSRVSMVYMAECQRWPVWKNNCREILGAGGLSFSHIA